MPREQSKCREWEKERRNRLNESFTTLCKLLPCYDPTVNTTKIDILRNAIVYIEELQTKIKGLTSEDKEVSGKEIKSDEFKKLQERIKRLLSKNEQLCALLRDAKITIPPGCCFIKKFKLSRHWANRVLPEQAKILQKNDTDKENNARKGRKLTSKNKNKLTAQNSTPKHRKAILNRSDPKKVRTSKKKKLKCLTPSKCVIVLSQSSITQPCYVITNTLSNNVLGSTSTVISNSSLVTNPLVSSKTPKTVPSVSSLGPGTLILSNGTIMPVLPQQAVLPLSSQIITRPPIVLLPQNPVVNSTSSVIHKNMTSGVKTFPRIRPKYCFTKTTQVNKVPIPALTSRYSNPEVALLKKPVRMKITEKNKEPEKKEEISEKRKLTKNEDDSETKKTTVVEERVEKEKAVGESEVSITEEKKQQEKEKSRLVKEAKNNEESAEKKKPDESLELNLNHSELSNDIFASLQVPSGCQNPESTSPTAAFLLAFPLVSSLTGVKVTEVTEEENTDSQRETPTLLQIGTMDSTKTTQSESLTPSLLNLDNLSFFSSKDISGFYSSFEGSIATTTESGTTSTVSTVTSKVDEQQAQPLSQVQKTLPRTQQNQQTQQKIQQNQQPLEPSQKKALQTQQNTQLPLQQLHQPQSLQKSQQQIQSSQQELQQPTQQQSRPRTFQQPQQQTLQKSQQPTLPTPPVNLHQPQQQNSHQPQHQNLHSSQQQSLQQNQQQSLQHSQQQVLQTVQSQTLQKSQQQSLQQSQQQQQGISQHQSQQTLQKSQTQVLQKPQQQSLNQSTSQQQNLQKTQTQNLQHQKQLMQQEKNQLVSCFENHPVPSFGTTIATNTLSQQQTYQPKNDHTSQKTFPCNNFNELPKISSSTCSYGSISKSYPEPLYTNSGTYTYGNTTGLNLNQNYYKDITKSDNRSYYSLNYENYTDYRKNEASNNSYFPSNYYYPKEKITNNNNGNNNKNKNGNQNRPPINWMTTPDNRLQTPSEYIVPQFSKDTEFYPTNSQTTYPMYSNDVATAQTKSLDMPLVPPVNTYQRTEVEENQFSWSPTKFPQFLDPSHSFVSSTLPTLVGDLALGNPIGFGEQKNEKCQKKDRRLKNYENNTNNQSNFLSVSQLVDHNKEVPARTSSRRNSGNRSSNKKVVSKTSQRKENKEVYSQNNNNKVDGTNNVKGPKQQVGYSSDVFCETSNKNRTKNSYSAEALIGQMQPDQNQKNRQQNYSNNKPLPVSSFLHDNIIPYFPTVDLPQDNTYIQQNQNYQTSSFSHNFSTTFQNSTYIPPTTTMTSSYNFMHDVTHDYSENLNLFSQVNKEKTCPKNTNRPVLDQSCPTAPKKSKRKHSNELPGFVDFPFLSVPGSINSPILPDDFHTHTGFLQPPTPQLYPCKNPFTKSNDLTSSSLLPLPPAAGSRSNIQHPDISPSINSAGTSLTNFNLSTIFPEINNKSILPDPFTETRSKEHPRSYGSTVQVSFNDKPTFSFSYINCTTSQSYNNQ